MEKVKYKEDFNQLEKLKIKENNRLIYSKDIVLKINDVISCKYEIEQLFPIEISNELLDKLLEVANNGFGIEMGRNDVKNHIYKSDDIFILKINGEVIGFSSLAYLENFVYRFGTVIEKKFQGQGLYKKLSNMIMDSNKKYFLRTQNQNVIKSLKESFDNVLYGKDAYDFINSDIDINDIEDFLINLGDSKKTLNTNGVFKGIYHGKMGEKSRVNYIDNDFYEGFSFKDGDSLLVIYFNNK